MVKGEYLKFPNRLSGNEHGQYNGQTGYWTAPVSGRYEFGLFVGVSTGPLPYYYQIYFEVDYKNTHDFRSTGTRAADSTNRDGRYFRTEFDLLKGQFITLEIYYPTPGLDYHGDSFFEGKLIKRL